MEEETAALAAAQRQQQEQLMMQQQQQQQTQAQQTSTEQSLSGILNSVRGVKREISSQSEELKSLGQLLAAQNISNQVKSFSGKASEYNDWIKSIDKYMQLSGCSEIRAKYVAFQTSSGVVSDFIERFLHGDGIFQDSSWATLKSQLKIRFGEIQDEQHALAQLQKLRQKSSESAAVFGERVYALAKEAFPEGLDQLPVQRQLISILVDGLHNRAVKMKLLRENPKELAKAMTLATEEETIRKRFEMRAGPGGKDYVTDVTDDRDIEPMDISHIRQQVCFKCQKKGHLAKHCKNRLVAQVQSRRELRCWHCNFPGHIRRMCPHLRGNYESLKQEGQSYRENMNRPF